MASIVSRYSASKSFTSDSNARKTSRFRVTDDEPSKKASSSSCASCVCSPFTSSRRTFASEGFSASALFFFVVATNTSRPTSWTAFSSSSAELEKKETRCVSSPYRGAAPTASPSRSSRPAFKRASLRDRASAASARVTSEATRTRRDGSVSFVNPSVVSDVSASVARFCKAAVAAASADSAFAARARAASSSATTRPYARAQSAREPCRSRSLAENTPREIPSPNFSG
mmetsp:Transcript_15726/g.66245  ORF Transcript_15726/g.66245 Transcript_15726/m.66245 type:complete len:229 (-) Transcript_15726:238-924(-)